MILSHLIERKGKGVYLIEYKEPTSNHRMHMEYASLSEDFIPFQEYYSGIKFSATSLVFVLQ
jgi:hypothetical protein